jgi:hypothetical protein
VNDLPDAIKAMVQQFFAHIDAAHANSGTTPLDIVRASFPFDVQSEHQADAFHYALHEHGDFVATGGRTWPEDRRRGLRSFYEMLRRENIVITYDPRHGWGHQERLLTDEDMLVRIENPTDKQRIIWRFRSDDLAP